MAICTLNEGCGTVVGIAIFTLSFDYSSLYILIGTRRTHWMREFLDSSLLAMGVLMGFRNHTHAFQQLGQFDRLICCIPLFEGVVYTCSQPWSNCDLLGCPGSLINGSAPSFSTNHLCLSSLIWRHLLLFLIHLISVLFCIQSRSRVKF